MDNLLHFLIGIWGAGLIVVVNGDLIWTTISLDGSGPVARVCIRSIFKATRRAPLLRPMAGPISHFASAVVWVALMWLGWTLLFLSMPEAIGLSDQALNFWGTVYYTGSALSTLGVGPYKPLTAAAQMATVMASLNGLVAITLSITYVLSVSRSVIDTRKLSAAVTTIAGPSAGELARLSFADGHRLMVDLADEHRAEILRSAQERRAFPLTAYFRPSAPLSSQAVALATLVDASVMTLAARDLSDADRRRLEPLLTAIGIYAESDTPADEPPPLTVPDDLDLDRETAERLAEDMGPTRRRLKSLLEDEGWDWPV